MPSTRLCLPLILLLALVSFGCNDNTAEKKPEAAASLALAVVNTDLVFQESNAGKAGVAHLDALGKELQAELAALQKEVETGADKEAAQVKLQSRMNEMQQRFSAEQQMVMNKVSGLYQQSMDTCRDKEGILAIVSTDAILSFSPKVDVTQKVVAEMNKGTVSFTEAVEPTPAPAGTPAPAAQNGTKK